jgi:protein SCO1
MKARMLLLAIAFIASSAFAGIADAATRTDVGGPFSLVDQDGARVTERSFLGRPVLLYFGYTTCPDVCPLDLAKIARIATRIDAEAGVDVKPVFVTVDPERDTPEKLKPYVHFFGADFSGLTGTPEEIAKIGDEYHVYYRKVPTAGGSSYMVDHSTVLFLLGADGAYLDHYGRALSIDEIVSRAVAKLKPGAAAPDTK